MAKQGFKILDSDMHVVEPPDLWERYIDDQIQVSRLPAVSSAITFAISEWSIPTAEIGRERRSDKTGQSRVTTLNATKSSIEVTQSADGRRKSRSRPWILRGIDVAVLYPTRGLGSPGGERHGGRLRRRSSHGLTTTGSPIFARRIRSG